jgi:hypothetical protein
MRRLLPGQLSVIWAARQEPVPLKEPPGRSAGVALLADGILPLPILRSVLYIDDLSPAAVLGNNMLLLASNIDTFDFNRLPVLR